MRLTTLLNESSPLETTVTPDARIAHLISLCASYGYAFIDTPVLQPASVFLTRAGDLIADHLFTFTVNGTQYALRPEFTSPAVVLALNEPTAAPRRWLFAGPVFERRPQGEAEQRMSFGLELLGLPGSYAEAEIIALAYQAAIRLDPDAVVALGHRGLTRAVLSAHGLDARLQRLLFSRAPEVGDRLIGQYLDHLIGVTDEPSAGMMAELALASSAGPLIGSRTRDEIAGRLKRKRETRERLIQRSELLDALQHWQAIACTAGEGEDRLRPFTATSDTAAQQLDAYLETARLLPVFGIPEKAIRLQPGLRREWDYYDGIIFDIRDRGGNALAGGGRYDELSQLMGANDPLPAVGFAMTLGPIAPDNRADGGAARSLAFVPGMDAEAVRISAGLRSQGIRVAVRLAGPEPADIEVLQTGIRASSASYPTPRSPDDFRRLSEALT